MDAKFWGLATLIVVMFIFMARAEGKSVKFLIGAVTLIGAEIICTELLTPVIQILLLATVLCDADLVTVRLQIEALQEEAAQALSQDTSWAELADGAVALGAVAVPEDPRRKKAEKTWLWVLFGGFCAAMVAILLIACRPVVAAEDWPTLAALTLALLLFDPLMIEAIDQDPRDGYRTRLGATLAVFAICLGVSAMIFALGYGAALGAG